MIFPATKGWFTVDSIDLTGVHSVNIINGWQAPSDKSIDYEVRLDASDGKIIGKGSMPAPKKGQQSGIARVPLETTITDGKFHTIYFIYKPQQPIVGGIRSVTFNSN